MGLEKLFQLRFDPRGKVIGKKEAGPGAAPENLPYMSVSGHLTA